MAKLQFDEFGIGLLAALRLKGLTKLDEHDGFEERKLHSAFAKAYDVICTELHEETVHIANIPDPFSGHHWYADTIMEDWAEKQLTAKDDCTSSHRIRISEASARKHLEERVIGGREPWLKAADAFIQQVTPQFS